MTFPSLRKIVSAFMKVIVALLVLGLGGVGYNYLVATKPEVPLRPRAEDVRKVAVVKAEIVSAEPRHQAFGTVTAARVSDLRFPISGEVEGVSAVMRNGAIVQSHTGKLRAKGAPGVRPSKRPSIQAIWLARWERST